MIVLEIINETGGELPENHEDSIRKAIEGAAEDEGISGAAEVCAVVVGDAAIKAMNAQYRGIDSATDVLSFPQYERDDMPPKDAEASYGDIVISLDRALAQAEEYGHGIERELGFLAVHGMLHLLGYDHETEADEAAMFAKQEEILAKAGLTR